MKPFSILCLPIIVINKVASMMNRFEIALYGCQVLDSTLLMQFMFLTYENPENGPGYQIFMKKTFGILKRYVIYPVTLIEMIGAIETLEEKWGIDRKMFFKDPSEYRRFIGKTQCTAQMSTEEIEELIEGKPLCSTNLSSVLKLDHFPDDLTIKEFLEQIPWITPSIFFRYLHSTSIVFANIVNNDTLLSTYNLLLLLPLYKFFEHQENASFFVKIWGYHGQKSVSECREEYAWFETKVKDFTPIEDFPINFWKLPINTSAVANLVMLQRIDKSVTDQEVNRRAKKCLLKKVLRKDAFAEIIRYLHLNYSTPDSKVSPIFRMDVENLQQIRSQLVQDFADSNNQMLDFEENMRLELTKYVTNIYNTGFQNLAKWEAALLILQELFPRHFNVSRPSTPHSYEESGTSSNPLSTNSSDYLFNSSNPNICIISRALDEQWKPVPFEFLTNKNKNSCAGKNKLVFNSTFSASVASYQQEVGEDQTGRTTECANGNTNSNATSSLLREISKYMLIPAGAVGPMFKLVPDGPPAAGWEQDFSWQQVDITRPIQYQNDWYNVIHNS
ncbi:hypothetical protein CRE_14760 [Caenorhabditis remanei]|nr:hypothetical protein CRE_14760 [Caenorhabditis remanei]